MLTLSSLKRTAWRTIAAVAITAGALAPIGYTVDTAAQDEVPVTAAAAPESTIALAVIDLNLEGAEWRQAEELLGRLGVPDAIDLWRQQILAEGASSGDFTEADLDALLGGELSIIVTPEAIAHARMMREAHRSRHDGTDMRVPTDMAQGVAAVLAPSDADVAWDYVERQLQQAAAKRDTPLLERSYGGAELLVIEPTTYQRHRMEHHGSMHGLDEAVAALDEWLGKHKRHEQPGFVAGHAGDFIIMGATPSDVTHIIDVVDGAEPSLAGSAALSDVIEALPGTGLSFAYVDTSVMVDSLDEEMLAEMQTSMPDVDPESMRGQLGVSFGASEAGFRLDTMAIPAPGNSFDTNGMVNDPAVVEAASKVPAESFFFQASSVPSDAFAGAAYQLALVVNAIASEQGWPSIAGMDQLPSQEEMDSQIALARMVLGFDPRTQFFDLLGGHSVLFSTLPSIQGETLHLDAAWAVETTDAATLTQSVGRLADVIGRLEHVAVTERSVGMDSVYAVSDASNAELPAIEFGVVGDYLVIGTGSGVDQLGGDPAAPLADDPQFVAMMAELPDEYGQITYVNVGQGIDLVSALINAVAARVSGSTDPVITSGSGLDAIGAYATVGYQSESGIGTSAILYIAGS